MKEQCIGLHRFEPLDDARSVLDRWVDGYNTKRPYQALNMKTLLSGVLTTGLTVQKRWVITKATAYLKCV